MSNNVVHINIDRLLKLKSMLWRKGKLPANLLTTVNDLDTYDISDWHILLKVLFAAITIPATLIIRVEYRRAYEGL
jgi:hypothetical protein